MMSRPVRALVVDDEPLARDTLRLRLAAEEDFEVVGEAGNGIDALEALEELKPDLIFLDIQMPDLSGFEVLDRLPKADVPLVVFVTAYDEYALRAFHANALAYLLKPFDDIRFAEALEHIRRLLVEPRDEARIRVGEMAAMLRSAGVHESPLSRLLVKSGSRTRVVPVEEIDWIEAAGNYATLHCGRDSHLLSRSLTELSGLLDPRIFVRVHRSALVNVARIEELVTADGRDFALLLKTGARVRLSRTYRPLLEAALRQRL